MQKECNLPYWVEVDIEFLPKAIESYKLNKKITNELPKKLKIKILLLNLKYEKRYLRDVAIDAKKYYKSST